MLLPRSSVPIIFLSLFAVLSVTVLLSLDTTYGTNQLVFFLAAGTVFGVASNLTEDRWQRLRWPMYLSTLVLLVIVLLIGRATNGAVSWIRFGSFRFQPSEILKPAILWLLAQETVWSRANEWNWKSFFRWSVLAGIPITLVMLQPDLGTTLITLVGVGYLFLQTRPPKWILVSGAGAVIILGILSWNFVLQPFQHARLLNFLNPGRDPLGSGYNARQSIIAVGSGQIWGLGLGNGLQSTLRFLPERQTDFLFATYAESTGLIGSTALILLYAGLFWYLAGVSDRVSSSPAKLFLQSGWLLLLAQTTINIGMNMGLLPITGVTLPLFSLGGTSLVSTALFLGMFESMRRSSLPILNLKREGQKEPAP
jgi:rod shape determining protein RodA